MTEIETRTVVAGGLPMHVAEAGPQDGPLVFLLHGFPEFWFEWRDQIAPFAEAGFRVVAPDQRGYNLTAKPKGVDAYRLDLLAGDIFALADALGRPTFQVVGHDWGASVTWWMASGASAGRIERMAIMNAPHPAVWLHAMTQDPEQKKKSRYVQMLRTPALPELMVKAGGYKSLAEGFKAARQDAFGPQAMAQYHAAWRQPGALTATINWYRALFRQPLPVPAAGSLTPPTLVLWGDQDAFAEPALAEQSAALCAEARVVHFPNASHWLPHDEPRAVVGELLDFLAR
jgi:epoxide hydrolase 4